MAVFLAVKDWPWWQLLGSLRPLLSATIGHEQLRAKEVSPHCRQGPKWQLSPFLLITLSCLSFMLLAWNHPLPLPVPPVWIILDLGVPNPTALGAPSAFPLLPSAWALARLQPCCSLGEEFWLGACSPPGGLERLWLQPPGTQCCDL